MAAGWKFVGKFKRGRKAPVSLECIVAHPDPEVAKGIARAKLIGADTITVIELSRADLKALNVRTRPRPLSRAPSFGRVQANES